MVTASSERSFLITARNMQHVLWDSERSRVTQNYNSNNNNNSKRTRIGVYPAPGSLQSPGSEAVKDRIMGLGCCSMM